MPTYAGREVRFFMPIIEGPVPAEWQIWGTTFERVCNNFEDARGPLPGSYRHLTVARLHVSLQTPEELFDRSKNQWKRFVGLLVDGSGPSDAQEAVFARVLRLWSAVNSPNALHRKLKRFHIGLLLPHPDAFDSSAADFAHRLDLEGSSQLAVRIEIHPMTTSRGFIDSLHSIEWQLMRDWINREREAA